MLYKEENAHYSLFYKIKDEFGNNVKVVDSYPEFPIDLPLVAVNLITVDFTKIQIGSYNNIREMSWSLDIFGKNKTQRDRISFQLMKLLENKIPIYDYSNGFDPHPTVPIGSLEPTRLRIEFVEIEIDEPEELFYRSLGVYTAQINILGGD